MGTDLALESRWTGARPSRFRGSRPSPGRIALELPAPKIQDKRDRDDGTFDRYDFVFDPELEPIHLTGREDPEAVPAQLHGGAHRQRSGWYPEVPRLAKARHAIRLVSLQGRRSSRPCATSQRAEEVEMLFPHLKTTMRFKRMRLRRLTGGQKRVPLGSRGPKTSDAWFGCRQQRPPEPRTSNPTAKKRDPGSRGFSTSSVSCCRSCRVPQGQLSGC
jgi:hypothetical protein